MGAKKQYTFVLSYGYAESQTIFVTPFTSKNTFSDAKAALLDLAQFFKERFIEQHVPKPKQCCLKAKESASEDEYCSKCGQFLTEDDFDIEHFMEFVRDMGSTDNDSYSSEFASYSEDHRWEPEGLGDNIRHVYTAEKVMAAAIGHEVFPGKTIESVFKDRTKSKSKDFSFW
jgi:hypothetical protein